MRDFLDILAVDAKATVKEGYYDNLETSILIQNDLREAILNRKATAVIAEIKASSPSKGVIRGRLDQLKLPEPWRREAPLNIGAN